MGVQGVELPLEPAELLVRSAHRPHAFLLDGGNRQTWSDGIARFGHSPCATLRFGSDGRAEISANGAASPAEGDPIDLLCAFIDRHTAPATGGFGGLVVAALAYDLGPWIDRIRLTEPAPAPQTVLFAAAYDWCLLFDRDSSAYQLATAPWADREETLRRLYADASHPRPAAPESTPSGYAADGTREEHIERVKRAKQHILAGDIYQVNLAQSFSGVLAGSPQRAFANVLAHHPMPFSAYLDAGGFQLLSNSPECLLDASPGRLATFPIKGTRARSRDAGRDQRDVAELRADPKEMAEHAMIVDLERNDLGRVAQAGTVAVDDLMRAVSFGSVHHLVSRISAVPRRDATRADILRAIFPGGSISGCPKLRAMEIIANLERGPRGYYTGSIGYFTAEQSVLNIAIRTAVVRGHELSYHAGGGIVFDSDPAREYDEVLLKAETVLRLLTGKSA